jgi:ubiquinone biosynthesis protein Coq4
MLRRNGADYPATYSIPVVVQELLRLQDHARIEELFLKARKSWPELDRWFSEGHVSSYTKEDLRRHAPGTVGHAFSSYLDSWGLELDLSTHNQFQGQYGYWMLRAGQQHDIEHILGGGGYDYIGEAVPNYMRIASLFKYFEPELARELAQLHMFLVTPAVFRTMLHYPESWVALWERQAAGTRVGQQSEAYFLQKYEDYFDLSIADAREKIGMRGVEDRDTFAPSDIAMEGQMTRMIEAAKAAKDAA